MKYLGKRTTTALLVLSIPGVHSSWAQSSATSDDSMDEFVLSPFEVQASRTDGGYAGSSTLAGNRLNTDVRDIGSALQVIPPEYLKDIGATDNASLLQYTTNTEVGGIYGNYAGLGDSATLNESGNLANPNSNTRVRGLSAAENARDLFVTDIPWDSYNTAGIDLQRGPNSILFGQGKPGGIINARTAAVEFGVNSAEISARYGSYGSARGSINTNLELIEDQLAIRVAGLYDDVKYKQDPAFSTSRRIYGAIRFEPEFLKRGSARTILKANIEAGDIRSNQPRMLPPFDRITPWFYGADQEFHGANRDGSPRTYYGTNRATYGAFEVDDVSGQFPGRGQGREVVGNPPQYNPAYNPWLQSWQFGSPVVNYDGPTGTHMNNLQWETRTPGGLHPGGRGRVDGTIGGIPYDRPRTIANYSTFAQQAYLPYSTWGIHKNKSLTDPSVFDFYNNLIDGPNKREWTDFRVYNISLAQTFLRDKVGLEFVYNREDLTRGQSGMLANPELMIDMMRQLPETYFDEAGVPYSLDNPNVGRPFIMSEGGNHNERISDRESRRLTAFVSHNFTDAGDSILRRIIGSHTLTGLLGEDTHEEDYRQWQRYRVGEAYYDYLDPKTPEERLFTVRTLRPVQTIYLGDSFVTSENAKISRPGAIPGITTGTIRGFDSTWIGTVDPTADWENGVNYAGNIVGEGTKQSENPANYAGWADLPFDVIDANESRANRDLLTTRGDLSRMKLSSKALNWQGFFWNRSIVATYGWREDEAKSWAFSRSDPTHASSHPTYGYLNLDPNDPDYPYRLPQLEDNRLTAQSRAWSVVGHINDLPGLDYLLSSLPVNISISYNDSSNFEALAQRTDYLGRPLSAPAGKTIDKGIRIETKDQRWSLKVNKYVTTVENASSQGMGGQQGAIGPQIANHMRWARRFTYAMAPGYTRANSYLLNPPYDPYNRDLYPDSQIQSYHYTPVPGQYMSPEAIDEAIEDNRQAIEDAIAAGEEPPPLLEVDRSIPTARDDMHADVAAWNEWMENPINQPFFEAWGLDPNNLDVDPSTSVKAPQGFQITENNRSEGYEIELSALPMPNWRLTLNASKTEAFRQDVGGPEFTEFMNTYQNALDRTRAGDLRIWWGQPGANTARSTWNSAVGSYWAAASQSAGLPVPELREWRVNMISNYRFTEGFLKDVNIGGALRYQSWVSVGYAPHPDALPTDTVVQLDVENPYRGPSETSFDFWIGYRRALTDRIDWSIQLNVSNAFQGDNELIPITVQPDGSPGAFRIAPKRTWQITNTLEF